MTERPVPQSVTFIGGGPTNGLDRRYERSLRRVADRTADEDFAQWWSSAPVPALELWYWLDVRRVCYRTRLTEGVRMTAQVERPVATTRAADDPAQLAIDDFTALLSKVAGRLGLPPAPPW